MGIFAVLKPIPPERLLEFKIDATDLEEFLNADDDTFIDLDKAWHGIHYLLTGAAEPTTGTLGSAIMGGIEIGEDLGLGPARFLDALEVTKVATALSALSEADLRTRFDPREMDKLGIYPNIWVRDGEEGFEYLRDCFVDLVQGYVGAANRGDAMLLFMS